MISVSGGFIDENAKFWLIMIKGVPKYKCPIVIAESKEEATEIALSRMRKTDKLIAVKRITQDQVRKLAMRWENDGKS